MALVGRDAPIMRMRPQSPSREAGKLPATEMYSTGAVTIAWAQTWVQHTLCSNIAAGQVASLGDAMYCFPHTEIVAHLG